MRLVPTPIVGAFVVEQEPVRDERGWFARTFDAAAFTAAGLDARIAQCSTSVTRARGTLRGLHYQAAPHAEAKLVRVVRGAAFDVIADLRPASATFGRWFSLELSGSEPRGLYLPPGCAHGFLTLADDTELHYQMSEPYDPESARGARWDDPALGIGWPEVPRLISERDRAWPLLEVVGRAGLSAARAEPE